VRYRTSPRPAVRAHSRRSVRSSRAPLPFTRDPSTAEESGYRTAVLYASRWALPPDIRALAMVAPLAMSAVPRGTVGRAHVPGGAARSAARVPAHREAERDQGGGEVACCWRAWGACGWSRRVTANGNSHLPAD
jgi:hypothetical protein